VRRQHPSGEIALKGQTAYMSPEYLEHRPYDRRSDVWTLGVVLWELLTGRRLFRKPSEAETLLAIVQEPIPAPSAFVSGIDRKLDDIVARAVSRSVDARYATADEMGRDLAAHGAGAGSASPPDVGRWLREILPDSLPTLTALVDATRCRPAVRTW